MNHIAVLGAGSWGTALAIQIARAGHRVLLWGRDAENVAAMLRERRNQRYLPSAALPHSLTPTANIAEAVAAAEVVIVAVPSHNFRTTLARMLSQASMPRQLAWATKGFERVSGLLPHQVVAEMLPADVPTAVLSGPTFAVEVAAGLPSALTIASVDGRFALSLARSISTDKFRAYTSSDMIGVEVGGATKNVFAIGTGISDGLGFGANTRIALVTRALAEMTRLGMALGAAQSTFMGLAGMGDLVLTCTDNLSRNRRFGLALAQGTPPNQALQEIGQVVEGFVGAHAVHEVAKAQGINMPIVEQIYRVLHEGLKPLDAVANLMARPLMAE